MPLHLTPASDHFSRRRFLHSLAGAGVILSPLTRELAFAADAGKPERWALLSDTHIYSDPAFNARSDTNMADNLRKVVAEVAAEVDSLDGVLIDGDCAYNDGQEGDYETLGKLLQPLRDAGLPIHLTMGNHDDREKFAKVMADSAKSGDGLVDGKHVSVVEGSQANWVFLDSLRFVNKVEGEFGEAQLNWLRGFLKANAEKPAILVGHHYLQAPSSEDDGSGKAKARITGLVDSEAFVEIAEQFPQAKAYVFGHSHDWKTKTSAESGFHEVNLPPTAYVFNLDRPNGWVRATVSGAGMELELRALDPQHPQHGERKALAWR